MVVVVVRGGGEGRRGTTVKVRPSAIMFIYVYSMFWCMGVGSSAWICKDFKMELLKKSNNSKSKLVLLTFIILCVQGHDGDVSATFMLTDTEATRTMWNGNKYYIILYVHVIQIKLYNTGIIIIIWFIDLKSIIP